jgi:hypothetical protein
MIALLAVIFIDSTVSRTRSDISMKALFSAANPNARLEVITMATYFSTFAASTHKQISKEPICRHRNMALLRIIRSAFWEQQASLLQI